MTRSTPRITAAGALAVALALTLAAAPASAKKKKKGKELEDAAVNLVWPPPPDPPRVRFVAQIRTGEDVVGEYKPSFIEKLTGRSNQRLQQRLIKPYGVAVRDEAIYVADPAQRAVLIFDRKGKSVTRWRGSAQYPLHLPIGVAFDAAGRLFVSDSYAGQVVLFSPQGVPLGAFGRTVFGRPGGMAIDDARRRIYVGDVKRNQVLVFNLDTLELIQEIGGPSTSGVAEVGLFSAPTNLALDSQGKLYVADTFNCRVQIFTPEGQFYDAIGTQGARPGNFMRPKGIALDSEDNLYVVDAEFNNFQIFSPQGEILLFVGSPGDRPGEFLLPTGMTIDEQDRIYIAEQSPSGGRVQIFQLLSPSVSQTPTTLAERR